MQALVTLATGLVVFLWARSLSNLAGGLFASAAWCFNPLALAFGHLIITDPGISLMLPLAVWMFSRFLESPRPQTAAVAGLVFGGALLTKYTAVLLLPTFWALAALAWWRLPRSPRGTSLRCLFSGLVLLAAVAWGMVLLMYLPHWSPPPPISDADAHVLRIPRWFASARWLWIPRDYFKGLTIMLLHVTNGSEGYLLGQWSDKGWWYYYPVAMLIKTPVALLVLLASAVAMSVRRIRRSRFVEAAPLVAAAVYLACALANRANIGIRHVLPIYPLLAVVVGIEYGRARLRGQIAGGVLAAWLAVTAFLAHADYLAYFNEIAGGAANGQAYLVWSDFDWGQDGKQLKTWIEHNHVSNPYLDFSGARMAITYLHIPYQRVQPAQVRELHDGCFIISASSLMSTNYDWLRASSTPVTRIGYTFFVYSLAASSNQPPSK
jgi:4-amino-4-deoxy-L-arabinose transferase-like glycosyltransferase